LYRFAKPEKFCCTFEATDLRNRNSAHSASTRSATADLDAIDRNILRRLQVDSLISNQNLADLVGLSPPACLKRVRRLREAGVIARTCALLSPVALGCPLLTVVRVKLERPRGEDQHAFEALMRKEPRVTACLTVAGDIDYVLLVQSRDVEHYQNFAREVLATASGIRSYVSEIVLEKIKWVTELPIDAVGE
jgi:Lrp/AsnC family leucine-responsive transcriptional regulator